MGPVRHQFLFAFQQQILLLRGEARQVLPDDLFQQLRRFTNDAVCVSPKPWEISGQVMVIFDGIYMAVCQNQ